MVEFWRQQVFLADAFVAYVGFKDQLIQSLELQRPTEVAKPYLLQEEPYIAERIERLRLMAS